MSRAIWTGALLAVVASAGVAWGQSVNGTVIINQKNGLPEPCRVVKKWTTAEGHAAFQLQSLDTDEMLTVVQKSDKKKGDEKVGVAIYRWGNRTEPPDGSPVPPTDSGIRQASFTTEEPPPHRPGDLPHLPAHAATSDVVSVGPPHTVGHPASCPADGCDKEHCSVVHRYEKPTKVFFRPGECVPVCTPTHAPNYGYYPTLWHAFPAGGETPPDLGAK